MNVTGLNGRVLAAATLFLLSVVPAVAQYRTDAQLHEDRLRELYGVRNWPGKDGGIRDGFRVTSRVVEQGFSLSITSGPVPSIDDTTGQIFVKSHYSLSLADQKTYSVSAVVTVAESCSEAHEQLFQSLIGVSRAQPPLTPRGTDLGLSIGDICYCTPSDGGFSSIAWVRNNVCVDLLSRDSESSLRLRDLARALDSAIIGRRLSRTYRQSPGRPVIAQVRGVGQNWVAASTQTPAGVTATRGSSNMLFSPSSTRRWPVVLPIVVTDDNMLGFPLSGLAKWVEHGPEADKASGDIEAFLSRFDPRFPEPDGERG